MPIRRYSSIKRFAQDIDQYASQAAAAGSRVLLLPELACVGLLWMAPGADEVTVATLREFYDRALTKLLSPYRDALSDVARRRDLWIVGATFWHTRNGAGTNTAFIAGPDGTIAEQDKLHPTRPEQVIGTAGGDKLKTFTIEGVKLGILVCYDIQFPELTRHLTEEGIEVLLVPSLTSERGYWRVRHSAHARAIENQIYVCVSPLVGDLGLPIDYPLQCTGGGYVTCPIDNRFGIADGLYAGVNQGVEQPLHAVLDLEKLRLSRSRSEIRQLKDRRPDFYATLRH